MSGCNWRVGQLYVLAETEGEARKVFDEGCGLWQTALQTCCVKRTMRLKGGRDDKSHKVDPDTFGITQRSLKMLRNTLIEKANRRITVVQIPTNDLCCGYLILDENEAVYTASGWTCVEKEGQAREVQGRCLTFLVFLPSSGSL